MSILQGLVARGVEALARHPELIDMAIHAVENGGVDEQELIQVIKDRMTMAAREALRKELEGG